MAINNGLFLEGFATPDVSEIIFTDVKLNRFVTEMCFKFGLKVMGMEDLRVVLCHPNGFKVCHVWRDTAENTTYYYNSPYYKKDRGRSVEDKTTFFSKNVSSLVNKLKKENIIPSIRGVLASYSEAWQSGLWKLEAAVGDPSKTNCLDPNQIHNLLKYAVGEITELPEQDICKTLLDKYNEADRIRDKRFSERSRFFEDGFTAVGVTLQGEFLIGKMKIEKPMTWWITQEFTRMKEFDAEKYSDIAPIMLMNKISYEDKTDKIIGGYIPSYTGYNADLDVIQCTKYVDSKYDMLWLLIPNNPQGETHGNNT
jgi:hypothetical protein